MPLQLRFFAIARTQCGPVFLYWTAFCPKAGHKKVSFKDCFSYESTPRGNVVPRATNPSRPTAAGRMGETASAWEQLRSATAATAF